MWPLEATVLVMGVMTGAVGWPWRKVSARSMPAPADDVVVLAAVADGDGEALGELYRRHGRAVFSYLLRMVGDRMVAEELLQDTLVAVWRGAVGFAGRSSVRTWIFGIARRVAIQSLRRVPAPLPVPVDDVEAADPSLGPEDLAVLACGGTAVAAAVAGLPSHHREVVALVMVAGLSLAEAARILDIPVGTVKSRLFHARAAVAQTLASEETR